MAARTKKQLKATGPSTDTALTVRNVMRLLESVVTVGEARGFVILDGEVRVTRDVVEELVREAPKTEVELMWAMFSLALSRTSEARKAGVR